MFKTLVTIWERFGSNGPFQMPPSNSIYGFNFMMFYPIPKCQSHIGKDMDQMDPSPKIPLSNSMSFQIYLIIKIAITYWEDVDQMNPCPKIPPSNSISFQIYPIHKIPITYWGRCGSNRPLSQNAHHPTLYVFKFTYSQNTNHVLGAVWFTWTPLPKCHHPTLYVSQRSNPMLGKVWITWTLVPKCHHPTLCFQVYLENKSNQIWGNVWIKWAAFPFYYTGV